MIATPMKLEMMCAKAARFAFFDRLRDAIQEVMVVPRSAPKEQATAACQSITPAEPRPMTMPMVAEDEWIIAVMSAAISTHQMTPTKSLALCALRTDITSGMLRRGLRPPVIR